MKSSNCHFAIPFHSVAFHSILLHIHIHIHIHSFARTHARTHRSNTIRFDSSRVRSISHPTWSIKAFSRPVNFSIFFWALGKWSCSMISWLSLVSLCSRSKRFISAATLLRAVVSAFFFWNSALLSLRFSSSILLMTDKVSGWSNRFNMVLTEAFLEK